MGYIPKTGFNFDLMIKDVWSIMITWSARAQEQQSRILIWIVGTKDSVDGRMDRKDMMVKDLVNFVDLKGTAVEKNHLVIGIKQMDVMEPSAEKVGINALQSLVLYSYNFPDLIYKDFNASIDIKGS